jgi:hypothetical protein
LKLCFLIFLLTWYGCCANLKKVTGFRGGTKTVFLGGQITKTIVVNLGSKEIQKEDTPVSFGNAVEDKWEEVEEYILSLLNNSEDELLVIPTKKSSVTADDDKKPAATFLEETIRTIQELPVIHPSLEDKKLPVIPTKNPSIRADDDKKPAATLLEETLRTNQEPPVIHPSLLPFGSSVVAWICEFCDCQLPSSQTRCGNCKRWKGGKRTIRTSGKRDSKEKNCVKGEGKEKG